MEIEIVLFYLYYSKGKRLDAKAFIDMIYRNGLKAEGLFV